MFIKYFYLNLDNFNKFNKGIIILDQLINKIKNVINLNIFNFLLIKIVFKKLKSCKISFMNIF